MHNRNTPNQRKRTENAQINPDTRLIDLTVGQLTELIAQAMAKKTEDKPKTVYGISGIASIFSCSYRTASRIKSSGIIDEAITQFGRTIVIDVEKALKLFFN